MTRRELLRDIAALGVCATFPLPATAAPSELRTNNLRFLLTEDNGRGFISCYGLDGRLISQKHLSLTASAPTHIALSADATTLAVSAADGKVVNLLKVSEDGTMSDVFAVHHRLFAKTPARFAFRADGSLQVDHLNLALRNGQLLPSGLLA